MKKDFSKLKPREVESYLREQVRKCFGDAVENTATIYSSHGYYDCEITVGKETTLFSNFRKREVPQIVKKMRAMARK